MRLFMRELVLVFLCSMIFPCYAADSENDLENPENLYSYYHSTVSLGTETLSLAEKNYVQLRDVLPLYQDAVMHPWPTIPETSKKLKIGVKNSAVIFLRERLKATRDLPEYYNRSDNLFDKPLAQAVKGFQKRNGLKIDGIVGKMTLQELNVPASIRAKQIVINMQRWASLAHRLNGRFIMVNVPDYELYVYDNNEKILSMKIIVGKPESETPELQSQISRLVFNPYWNVPTKIAQNEIVKKVQEDPSYLDSNRLKILSNEKNYEIDQDKVDWRAARENGFPYRFRQEPGLDNSLGVVKFEFQNSHDVYLHDTPVKELFNQDERALSHGCVRLENPLALVDFLMDGSPDWSEDYLQEIIASEKTKYVKAYRPTPILITYITAWVDENGAVNFRDDIYGKD
ncbi:MAG TPA: L,D-transpeptidase family protein [Gammaproteobacteria bacterium]|nr:L,D-transpeptidase family protein [Gammaproteobacteria bacterium]